MRRSSTIVAAPAVILALVAPALAATGAGGAARDHGQRHAIMAQEMGGFTGERNPGIMHQGFYCWIGV